MKHVVVYKENNIYAGWPANHGAWQWGDELLVGFLRGDYRKGAGHNIMPPYQKVLSRSYDGGLNWNIEIPNVDFECSIIKEDKCPSFSLSSSIIRICGVYDTGGERCLHSGGFYLSSNKGKTWGGAYPFTGLEQFYENDKLSCTSRTCVLQNRDLLFLSASRRFRFGTDFIFCVKHEREMFRPISVVCQDNNRAVMPAVVELDKKIFVVCRRRNIEHEGWIDIFVSDDDGNSFSFLSFIGITGGDNGNPPALIEHNSILYCAFGNRTNGTINIALSIDLGLHWKINTIRSNGKDDIGYPRLFKNKNNEIVCVYYWADNINRFQHIACTIFAPKEIL